MDSPLAATLPKEERLCGKTSVSALISDGKWGSTAHIRYCWAAGRETGLNRIIVSVPKKFFKRAVKRNLLKRRMREAYRTQKHMLTGSGMDIMFSWSSPEVSDFETVRAEIEIILRKLEKTLQS